MCAIHTFIEFYLFTPFFLQQMYSAFSREVRFFSPVQISHLVHLLFIRTYLFIYKIISSQKFAKIAGPLFFVNNVIDIL